MIDIKTLSEPDQDDLEICALAARLSHRSTGDGGRELDLALLSRLVKAGDEHAKAVRGLMAYVSIYAPRYWWHEMVTYRVGCEQLGSESTMHDQPKLVGRELQEYKAQITEGTYQRRIFAINYQALRRIYNQRKSHRLPEWHDFCDWVEDLPYAKELILI